MPRPLAFLETPPAAGTLWPDRDEAFLQVAKAVREATGRLSPPAAVSAPVVPAGHALPTPAPASGPRSSNLRLAKHFSQRNKDQFKRKRPPTSPSLSF